MVKMSRNNGKQINNNVFNVLVIKCWFQNIKRPSLDANSARYFNKRIGVDGNQHSSFIWKNEINIDITLMIKDPKHAILHTRCRRTYYFSIHWGIDANPEARFMGPTWGPSGAIGPRWAPCWPHEHCYLGNMCRCTGSSWVPKMACRLLGTKPLPETILPYRQLQTLEPISEK